MPSLVSVDRRCCPSVPPRCRYTITVQIVRYLPWGTARNVLGENPAHYHSFALDDCKFARLSGNRSVPKSPSASMAPVPNNSVHTPPDLVCEIGKVERPEQTAYTNLNLIGRPFMDRVKFYSGKGQALPNPREVFLIP